MASLNLFMLVRFLEMAHCEYKSNVNSLPYKTQEVVEKIE